MRILVPFVLSLSLSVPAFSQDIKGSFVKHLKTSRDFTLKVAEGMPDADYSFKLTAPQMSFAEQLVHLSQGFEYFLSPFSDTKPNPPKPESMSKAAVTAFVKARFESAIERVEALTPKQIAKAYKSEEGNLNGLELLMGLMEHTSHHRASAEMYLRAKGITPPEYEF
jgi:uncharacterized damage-inducible protein DinB